MRFVFLFLTMIFFTAPALASPQQWQAQLQSQLQSMRGNSVNFSDNVQVTEGNNMWRAQLPPVTVQNPDDTIWSIPSIILTRPATGDNVTIQLPPTITQKDTNGKSSGMVTIGQQSLSGQWNDATGQFQSLQGQLSRIRGQRNEGNAKLSIADMTIATPKTASMTLTMGDLRYASTVEARDYAAQVKSLRYTYEFQNAKGLGFEQILGLLQQNALAYAKNPVTMRADASDVTFVNKPGVVNHIASLASQVMVTPKGDGKTADVRNNIKLTNMERAPAQMNDVFLPKNAEMTGTVLNLPLSALAFASNGLDSAKQNMAMAKTRVNFDSIKLETKTGAHLTGSGSLLANANVPTGFTGRLTFKTENIASVSNALQNQASQPGASLADQAQAMMTVLMMQGLGAQQNQTAQYVLDLTPLGQTLVNGQDISTLVNLGLGKTTAPSATPQLPATPPAMPDRAEKGL